MSERKKKATEGPEEANWEDRMQDEGNYLTELILRETEVDVNRVYRQAVDEVQKKLDDYLRRFQLKDLNKKEQLSRGEITAKEYADWRKGQIMMGKRWQEMVDTLSEDLHNANNLARSIVNGHLPEVYAVNHNYGTFQVEKGSLVDTSYTLYDRQTVERIIRDQPDILPAMGPRKKASIAAGKDIAWQKGQIQSVTLQGILQGESIPKLSRRIARTMGETNKKATVRYARTSVTAAQNAGRVDSYRRAQYLGIDLEQEWLATLDGRTRHEHRQLDGQHVKVGDPFMVDGKKIRYPGDPTAPAYLVWNCRCTLVPRVMGTDQSNAPRDNRLGGMSYQEWKAEHEKPIEIGDIQSQIGRANTVDEVNTIMNSQGWWAGKWTGRKAVWNEEAMRYDWEGGTLVPTVADLTGCDLDSAKSVASAYDQVFEKYPQLKGKLDAPDAHPIDMKDNTYAWCYMGNGQVQVNPNKYNNWSSLVARYERDVRSNWHPVGTTAEGIVTHEIGHAVDGLLARLGVLGGRTSSGEFRYASSSMKATVMNRAFKIDSDIRNTPYSVSKHVSRYAATDTQEWFAECFAEYITSASPRTVATEFGKKLEELMKKVT